MMKPDEHSNNKSRLDSSSGLENMNVILSKAKFNQISGEHNKSARKGLAANQFRVLLDTGSTNAFLIGSECHGVLCESHQKYNVNW